MSSVLPQVLSRIGKWSGYQDFDETLAVLWLCSTEQNDEGVKRAHTLLQSHPGMIGPFNPAVVSQPRSPFTFFTRVLAISDNQLALSELPPHIRFQAMPTGSQVRSSWIFFLYKGKFQG